VIVPHHEIAASVLDLYRSGGFPKGSSTGWPSLDKLYTVGMSQWTLVTGTPNSGKSEFVDALMVNLALKERWKFFIYSPENWPLALHHAKIIEKYIRKPFNPGPNERATEAEVLDAEEWIKSRFVFCKPDSPSLEAILSEAALQVDPFDRWKMGVVIDPWNQLEHSRPSGLSETEYVSKELSFLIDCVRSHKSHVWLIAHPAKMQKDRDGKYPVPTPRDVSGSAHFWNKADNCLTVWRDQVEGSQDVDVHVQKVRFKHIGRIGLCSLRYDRVTGTYHEPLTVVKDYKMRAANEYEVAI